MNRAPPKKVFHNWQQSTDEAEYLISKLTLKNQVIFDPMMGSGTNGIAALKLGRKFVGIEKDPEVFKVAKNRIFHPIIN